MVGSAEGEFADFVKLHEPKLRIALMSAYGPERGRDATAEALAYGWEHWDRVRGMDEPVGYLCRVGQSKSGAPMASPGTASEHLRNALAGTMTDRT